MKKVGWIVCKTLFIGLILLCFSPIIIDNSEPTALIFGLPKTLLMGIGIALFFILLTILGSIFIKD